MLINNFINKISKPRSQAQTVKQMNRTLSKYYFTNEAHFKLLKHDALAHTNIIDDGKTYLRINNLRYEQELQIKFFVPYAIEKLICRSSEKKLINEYRDIHLFSILENSFNRAGNLKSDKDGHILQKLFFFLGFEQMSFQEETSSAYELNRLFNLYNHYPEVNEHFTKKYGLSIEKTCILIWAIYIFITEKQNHKTTRIFSIAAFKSFITIPGIIEENEVNAFVDYLLLNKEEFISRYNYLRTDHTTGKLLSYEKQQEIDKYLPKISFKYPLLYDESKENMILTSYTSLVEFLNLEKVYADIYSNQEIPDFKSKIHGHAINDYLKEYAIEHTNADVYGDEKYYPIINGKPSKRNGMLDAPDVIIEFENYVLIIECKSKPFDLLNSLKNYSSFNFKRLEADYEKSKKNIKRYLKHQNSYADKKIFRFYCYFFPYSTMLNSTHKFNLLKSEDKLSNDDVMLTDIKTIEYLLRITSKHHNEIIEDYIQDRNDGKSSSLFQYLYSKFYDDFYNDIDENKFNKNIKSVIDEKFLTAED